jgi:hypothetical protein
VASENRGDGNGDMKVEDAGPRGLGAGATREEHAVRNSDAGKREALQALQPKLRKIAILWTRVGDH